VRDRIVVRRAFSGADVLAPTSSHEQFVPPLPELRDISCRGR
jgi:hypothetical protein